MAAARRIPRAPASIRFSTRRLLRTLALLALAGCGPTNPNLVLIIGDDHGYQDYGFMGSPHVQTPNLDRLASEGTVFTQGYVTASLCAPSRRTLLTGLQPHQWGAHVVKLRQRGIHGSTAWIRQTETLPRLLGENGYVSLAAGKFPYKADYRSAGFTHGMGNVDACGETGLARRMLDPVQEFIESHRDDSFFIWFAPCLPHVPHDAPPAYEELYEDLDLSRGARSYYANISRFDDAVGELIELLERQDLSRKTLVLYISDNGWDQGPRETHFLIDGPKGKMTMYDKGFRTPLVFRWPGRIKAGAIHEGLVSSADLLPTLLGYAGIAAPPGRSAHDLGPILSGTESWTHGEVIGGGLMRLRSPRVPLASKALGRMEMAFFLRTQQWHYIEYPERGVRELYDMRSDPFEDGDLIAKQPARAKGFHERITKWRAEMKRSNFSR